MRIPTVNNPPTPSDVREARKNAGLSQREASLMIFGADSLRGPQNWELGKRLCPLGSYMLLLLMTDQITLDEAKTAQESYKIYR